MIYLAIIFFVIAAVLFAIRNVGFPDNYTKETYRFPGIFKTIAGVVGVVGLLIVVFSCLRIVDSGQVGVKRLFGQVYLDQPMSEGLHFVNPFLSVEPMSIRTEVYTMSSIADEGQVAGDDSIIAISSDDLKCPLDLSITYRLNSAAGPWVFQNLGPNYGTDLVRAAVRTAVRSAAKDYTAEQLRGDKREEAAEKMREETDKEIKKILATYESPPEVAIVVSNCLLRHVGIPERVWTAIEEKLAADQRAQQMEFEIMRAEKEKEKMQKEGEAIDNYNVAASKNLTTDLLRLRAIDATKALAESRNTKVVIIGGGDDGLPVILNDLATPAK